MKADITVVDPESESKIKISYGLISSSINDYSEILVISYSGKYGIGAAGNSDAQYMYAKGEFGLNMYETAGVIIDLRELEYEWGDMLELVFTIGKKQYRNAEFPRAVLIGEKCSKAIGTLIHGEDSKTPAITEEWIFDSFENAWDYIDRKINTI